MAEYFIPFFRKVSVPLDMIQMFFRIDYYNLITRSDAACIAIDSLSRNGASSRVDDQCFFLACNKAGIYTPGRYIIQTRYGVTIIGELHSIPLLDIHYLSIIP